jgi:hypothetical protein
MADARELSGKGKEPSGSPERSDVTQFAARRFVLGVSAVVVIVIGAFVGTLALLHLLDRLPPPPLTGNACMDEKFKFLAERDLRDVDLIAVGSSVTWRNLDVAAFRHNGMARRPLNAAPCYLYVSQVVFFTEFLLNRMPRVATVVTVVAPRDFEQCTGPRDAFFPAALADAYVFHGMPSLPIYLSRFEPQKFVPDVVHIRGQRNDAYNRYTLVMDDNGAGPLLVGDFWMPKPVFDDTCFAALSELERVVVGHGAKLIVAIFPLQPEWRAHFDPDGQLLGAFERRVRASLGASSTLVHSGLGIPSGSFHYADSIHFLWDSAMKYSVQLAGDVGRTVQGRAGAAAP